MLTDTGILKEYLTHICNVWTKNVDGCFYIVIKVGFSYCLPGSTTEEGKELTDSNFSLEGVLHWIPKQNTQKSFVPEVLKSCQKPRLLKVYSLTQAL
jgi:hypothetical protein